MYKNILFPIDINNETWKTCLPNVLEYMKACPDAVLHIMTAIPDYSMSIIAQHFSKDAVAKVVEGTKAQLHKFVDENVKTENVKIGHVIVARGAVYESIIKTATKVKADLIMVSAHRPELKDYLLGPNAAKVVRHSEISVLVMRH